jgi:hypothetical protein
MTEPSRRPLKNATMFGTPAGASARPRLVIAPPLGPDPGVGSASDHYSGAASPANRIDALTKLKSLLDSGVLTPAQYESELARLTDGI